MRSLVFVPTVSLVMAVLLCTPALGDVFTHVEDFTSRDFCNESYTTALWDDAAGELRLHPFEASIVATYPASGEARDVFVDGDYAYLACYNGGVQIIDVSDPANPVGLGSYTGINATGVAASGNAMFVTHPAFSMMAFDVSDPSSPVLRGTASLSYNLIDVRVEGQYAYVANYTSGMYVVNVKSPWAPTQLGNYNTPGSCNGIDFAGDYVFVADGSAGLQVISVADPESPSLAGSYNTPGTAEDVVVEGDYAFVADGGGGIVILDVTTPSNPAFVTSLAAASNVRHVAIAGDHLYVADGGLRIFDITDPSAPVFLQDCPTPGVAWNVAVHGDYAYVADGSGGLAIIKIADPVDVAHKLGDCEMPGVALDVTYSGNYAYVARREEGLYIADISDPSNPVVVANHDTPLNARDVAVSGDYAFVAHDGGLLVLDVSDPHAPDSIGSYPSGGDGLAVWGDYAFTSCLLISQSIFIVIDISDPTHPVELTSIVTPRGADEITIAGSIAYCAMGEEGIAAISVMNPLDPTIIGYCDTPGWASNFVVAGDYGYVADTDSGLQVVDISDPTNLTIVANVTMPGWLHDLRVAGDRVYAANDLRGVVIFDVSDPFNPTYVSESHEMTVCYAVDVVGEYALAVDYEGLTTFQIQNKKVDVGPNIGQSLAVDRTTKRIVRAKVRPTADGSITWELSPNGGGNWEAVTPGEWHDFWAPGSALLWRATLDYEGGAVPACTQLAVDYVPLGSKIPSQAVPNPMNPVTRIHYGVPVDGEHVTLKIYDVSGRLVRTLVDQPQSSGEQRADWNGENGKGAPVASGVYFYTLTIGDEEPETKKLTVLR